MSSALVEPLVIPTGSPALPAPRGPLSAAVISALQRSPGPIDLRSVDVSDPIADDDLQLALYCCYELHYRGFDAVDEAWEWSPALLAARATLEAAFADALVDAVGPVPAPLDVAGALRDAIADAGGPSLSEHMATEGTLDQLRELCIHRSAYQHASLFAESMRSVGLDPTYGAYLDRIPGVTLATTNLITFFGLHRRWRGALVGHLAGFEMTSVTPMGWYATALDRLGIAPAGRRFYDVHVEADARHEQLAAGALAGGLVEAEPDLAADVVFGAKALLHVEERFATHVMLCWSAGGSSLRS